MVKRCGHTTCSPPDSKVKSDVCLQGVLGWERQMSNDKLSHLLPESFLKTKQVHICYQLLSIAPTDQGSEVKPSFVTTAHWLISPSPSAPLCPQLEREGIRRNLPELLFNPWVSKLPLGFGWKGRAGWNRVSLLALTKHSTASMDSGPRPPGFESWPSHLPAVTWARFHDLAKVSVSQYIKWG